MRPSMSGQYSSSVGFSGGCRGDRPATSALGISPGAKRALETSVDEARAMGHDYIGTEHLLLALARKRKDIATGMLASMGVTQQRIGAVAEEAARGQFGGVQFLAHH
ncbi:MAG: hypothetical protein E6J42_10960 [Chloroflexi bacterium]|nr:MAG: hypothetical protein E6J42_10960 [Chloroflexota bacterium]